MEEPPRPRRFRARLAAAAPYVLVVVWVSSLIWVGARLVNRIHRTEKSLGGSTLFVYPGDRLGQSFADAVRGPLHGRVVNMAAPGAGSELEEVKRAEQKREPGT